MRFPFGRKAARPLTPASPSAGATGPSAVDESFTFRPGDCLNESDCALFPVHSLYDLLDGYRLLGLSWDGACVELDPDNRVECIDLTRQPGGLFGLANGMPEAVMRHLFPWMATVESQFPEQDRADGLIFHQLLLPGENLELLATTRDGGVVRLALARAGYWHDPHRRARELRREQAAAQAMAADQARLEALRAKDTEERENRNRWRSIADTDAMLDAWCAQARPDYRAMGQQLRAAPPAAWLDFAERYSFDEGLAPLFWIIRQPRAEIADIFEIFTMCEPDYFLDPEKQARGASQMTEYELIDEIKARVDAGFYSVSQDFDGVAAWDNGAVGRRNADFMAPVRNTFRRQFSARP